MCEFISFSVDRNGNVYCILGEDRQNMLKKGENPDSHSVISDYFKIDEDNTWKFEIPLNKNDIDKLCNGELPDKLSVNDIDILRKWYIGGIPFGKMPIEIFDKIVTWVYKHLEDIEKAGLQKYASTIGDLSNE